MPVDRICTVQYMYIHVHTSSLISGREEVDSLVAASHLTSLVPHAACLSYAYAHAHAYASCLMPHAPCHMPHLALASSPPPFPRLDRAQPRQPDKQRKMNETPILVSSCAHARFAFSPSSSSHVNGEPDWQHHLTFIGDRLASQGGCVSLSGGRTSEAMRPRHDPPCMAGAPAWQGGATPPLTHPPTRPNSIPTKTRQRHRTRYVLPVGSHPAQRKEETSHGTCACGYRYWRHRGTKMMSPTRGSIGMWAIRAPLRPLPFPPPLQAVEKARADPTLP